jgi:hypothetical protein
MANLFAICRNGNTVIKRVQITQEVQAKIEGIFQAQAGAFLDGVTEEVVFGGDWRPDSDEILVIDAPDEVAVILAALDGNQLALPTIDANNFQAENIRALFTAVGDGRNRKVLIQLFTAQQLLSRRFSLLLDGNTFRELTAPAFTLDNFLVAIIEDNKLKFKSFFNVKRIFQLNQLYQEASDQQIDAFCSHEVLQVSDLAGFKHIADQPIRKLVHAIHEANVLDEYTVDDIIAKANYLGLNLMANEGRLVMPTEKKEIKKFLRFLDDGIYEAALTAKRYMTNSKRPLA